MSCCVLAVKCVVVQVSCTYRLNSKSLIHYLGLQCHVEGCEHRVGSIAELKDHFRMHGISTSAKTDLQIRCTLCRTQFWYFRSLSAHIKKYHPSIAENPPTINEEPLRDDLVGIDAEAGDDYGHDNENQAEIVIQGLTHPYFNESNNISLAQLSDTVSELITRLRCDVTLPENKLQAFIEVIHITMKTGQIYMLAKTRQFLAENNISFSDSKTIDFINSLYIPNLATAVGSLADNLTYLSMKADCSIPEPVTIVLAKRICTKKVLRTAARGKSFHNVFKHNLRVVQTRTQKDTVQYLSIIETLRLILTNPEARQMIDQEKRNTEDTLQSFKDGNQFLRHPFLQRFPNAIRLSIHLDEGEYCNPLGSRKSKNKLTNIYFKIQNMDPKINSALDRVYLLSMIKSSHIKTYGYAKVLKPLIDDLLKLESDEGVTVRLGNNFCTMRAILVSLLGDTLAVHDIFGMLSASANKFCRLCEISRARLHLGQLGDHFPERTTARTERQLENVLSKRITPKSCGLKKRCALHALTYFRWPENLVLDPMHDLLEGVVPMVIKLILRSAIRSARITDSEINSRIAAFDYGETEIAEKPSSNFSSVQLKSKGYSLSQSASQIWLLFRAFPFIFRDILNESSRELIASMLQICYLSFSNKLNSFLINDFENVIIDFHHFFKECFPSVKAINKVHHLAHYPKVCRESGPIANFSCLMFEAKFKESKAQGRTNTINLPLSLSKRLGMKQANSIMHHNYKINEPVIAKKTVCKKEVIDTKLLLGDLPEMITLIQDLSINSTSFRPGYIVKYLKNNGSYYGILLYMVQSGLSTVFVIQELDVLEFDRHLSAYKVVKSVNVLRATSDKILSRKTYSLWTLGLDNEDYYYISIKYNDD